MEAEAKKYEPGATKPGDTLQEFEVDGFKFNARYLYDIIRDSKVVMMTTEHRRTNHTTWSVLSPDTWNALTEDLPMLKSMWEYSTEDVRQLDGACNGAPHTCVKVHPVGDTEA